MGRQIRSSFNNTEVKSANYRADGHYNDAITNEDVLVEINGYLFHGSNLCFPARDTVIDHNQPCPTSTTALSGAQRYECIEKKAAALKALPNVRLVSVCSVRMSVVPRYALCTLEEFTFPL